MVTMVTSVTAAARTVDMDGSVDSATGTPAALERTIWAIPMELAAAGGGGGSPNGLPHDAVWGWAMILHSTYFVYVGQFVNPVQR